jgi:hypothetical protein
MLVINENIRRDFNFLLKTQVENIFPPKKVFRFLRIRKNSKYKQEIRFRIDMAKAACNRKTTVFTCKLDLNVRKKTSEVLHLEHSIIWC